ncbi:S-layer homology domain-containing protein [Cohnella ginsengisoli]|uniref:S-layer homology domain-containing protein n=1 Tax=Cohnella ginsengisoli TaxID=425004 RepID=A0A9X4QQQ7_9BACL|nr:S-layer homology domain-containing protein [Cohnella ginsengisoli]MDG0795153.1 S-layer homology domain-containing protein [Cohnella ginsengisoli]
MAGATIKAIVNFEDIAIPVTTNSNAQFSNYPVKVKINEAIPLTFAPPEDPSKIYKPQVKFRDALNPGLTSVYPCTFVRTDAQDQTKSVYTCPAVTKSSTQSVELLYDSTNIESIPGAVKTKTMASIAPNSKLAGIFKSIVVYGTNMNGRGEVLLGTSPNPTVPATVSQTTSASLVVSVPAGMLSNSTDVTYYISINGVQRSVTIATAQNLSHTAFGSMAVVSDNQFKHSVIVAQSEKELTQQLGGRNPIVKLKGSFTASATVTGEYAFSGTTIINGGLTSYLPTGQSKLRVRDDAGGGVTITMDKVTLVAGAFNLLSESDASIELEKGVQYVTEYAKDPDGELLDPDKQNVEIAFDNRNQLTVLGSGMTAKITGAALLGNAMMFDGKVYFGMALPGSSNVGFGLNIDRLQYGADGQGSLSFQGVKADGYFTPGNDMSKKLLGGFGLGATAEGSIDTFESEYSVALDVDAKLANFAANMSLKKNSATGQFIPDTIKIVVGLGDGIPVTPALPIAKLTRVGGGVSGLADTITGNYKGVAPILILINGDLEVGSLIPGNGLLEFSDVQLAIGPSQISLSGNPKLLKMEVFDKFQAGIYVTNTSVSYQMQVAANILKNFSVILAGGNANLTYYRGGSYNLNGQLYGRLQIPEIEVGLFSIGPYTLLNSNIGLSDTNAYATFSVLGFGLKVNYAYGSGSVGVGRRTLRSIQSEQTGQTVFDENGNAAGQINAFSNVSLVASSDSTGRLRTLALTPSISTNDSGTVHTVSFPEGLTDDYAVLVSADSEDMSILDPDGNPYGLTYPVTLADGTPFYDDPNANAAVVSDNTIMIRLGRQPGDWTISSSQSFDSSVIAIAPVPKIAGTTYDAGTRTASWDLTGLDTETEDYRVEVRLSTDNGDDPTQTGAGVLVHTVDIVAGQVTDGIAGGSYAFTAQDLSYLQSGQYYPRVTLIGTPKSDASRTIPYASLNAKQAMDVVNPLAPDSVSAVSVSAGGGGTIHATWSAVSNAHGYLIRLLDADGNAVMSPLKYTDEIGSDGNPTGNQIAHAGRPIEYQISADDAVGGAFAIDFGGMEPGNSYKLAVTPYASADPSDSNASSIYGASTVTAVVDVPLVKTPVIHVAPSLGAISSDSLLGNVLTVNGDFKLDVATTYVSAEDGQSRDLNAKFTVWQSDGTIDAVTNMPNFNRIYISSDYEPRISVPISVDGDAGSSLIRIVAENDQGDVYEYGLAVHYNHLPPALFVETGPDGKIVTDSEGRYQIQGSTVPYATVLDSRGSRTTADNMGKFSMSGTLNADKKTYITLTAIDYVGNLSQDDVTIVKGNESDDPGTDPGTNPGTDPGTNPGTNPGKDGVPAGTGQTDGSTDNGNPPKSTFKDVHAEAPWAEAAIEKAYKMGLVAGRAPEVFAPNSDTRRAEAIAMLVRARQLTIGNQADLDAAAAFFADWNELAEWSKPYAAAAYANGLISGSAHNGKHYVKGSSFVTRAEIAVLFQNAYQLKADASNRKTFLDRIPSWAANSVEILASNGAINGYPNATFMPGSNATRAEVVLMLMRLIERE